MNPPEWAETIGWICLALGGTSAIVIAVDEMLGHRQQMAVMNLVHPITALYLGPMWLWLYFSRARRSSVRWVEVEAERLRAQRNADDAELKRQGESVDDPDLSRWNVANAVSHCGAGCTLGDIVGEWVVFAAGLTIAGATLYPELIVDFALAWTLGIVFQYFSIAPMRPDLRRKQAIWLAIRADTLSIVSFQIGMSVWMIASAKALWSPPLPINSAAHWWMMQVAMIAGFVTAWPVNRLLIRIRWKEKMDYRRHLAATLEERNREAGGEAREAA